MQRDRRDRGAVGGCAAPPAAHPRRSPRGSRLGADAFQASLATWACRPATSTRGSCPGRSGTRRGRGRCCGRPCRARRRLGPASSRKVLRSAARRGAVRSVPSTSHCAEVPGAQAVGGKLLAGQVHQPDVAAQLARPAQLAEDGRRQHQGGGGRVVVVGPGGRQPRRRCRRACCRSGPPCRPCRNGRP